MSWEIIAHVQLCNTSYSFTSVRQQLSFECLRELEQLLLKGSSPKPVVVVNPFAQQSKRTHRNGPNRYQSQPLRMPSRRLIRSIASSKA